MKKTPNSKTISKCLRFLPKRFSPKVIFIHKRKTNVDALRVDELGVPCQPMR